MLGGFDWGGNASCTAAALWPERIGGRVSYASYDMIHLSQGGIPLQHHRSVFSGISISSEPNAVANARLNATANYAGCCGANARPAGRSTTQALLPMQSSRFAIGCPESAARVLEEWTNPGENSRKRLPNSKWRPQFRSGQAGRFP